MPFTRTKIRNLINQSVLDRTFKTGEKITPADTEEREMQFLYNDGSFHFMDNQNYEQISLDSDVVGDYENYLTENMEIQVSFYKSRPIGLTLPNFVNLAVTETAPGEKEIPSPVRPNPQRSPLDIVSMSLFYQ